MPQHQRLDDDDDGDDDLNDDLVAQVVVTADNRVLQVTGSTGGFFVNRSTADVFDPQEAEQSHRAATLANMLQHASPLFKKLFAKLLLWRINQVQLQLFPDASILCEQLSCSIDMPFQH